MTPDPRWTAGPRTLVRDVGVGASFTDISGLAWIRGRRHGSHRDVFLVTAFHDGYESCFGGGSEVVVSPVVPPK